jgi:hypothetical protein
MEFDPQLFCDPKGIVSFLFVSVFFTDCVSVSFNTESCVKVDPFDMNSLILDYLGCQHGIQSTGNQGNCASPLSRCGHGFEF